MPAMRKRSRTVTADSPTNTPPHGNHDQVQVEVQAQTTQTQKISVYEQSREQRIRENRERMEKLGIMDLSLKLKPQLPPSRRIRINHSDHKTPLNPPGPLRRSSRLQNVVPVSYSEVAVKKAESIENGNVVIEAGSKPEVYTAEHESLLGNTEKKWTLFVDGYGKDGRRIYDPIKGKTCHQCRQKTLGYRTQCNKCNMVQGQFCGDCLYMRYGEHVVEALQNPTWLCPVCRGICNCSLCRQAKGWAPTGPLYKKISALGYKSVAHYLFQTHRSDVEKNADASNPDVEINESPEVDENHLGSLNPQAESDGGVSVKRLLLFSDAQDQLEKVKCLGVMKPQAENDGDELSTKRSLCFSDEQDQLLEKAECLGTTKPLASSSKPLSDRVAGRLRPRVRKT